MEWEVVETRVISGKGVLKVPGSALKSRSYVIFTDIVRNPKNMYVNRDWNPQRSRFANLVFMRQGYVIANLPVEFDGQAFDSINDVSGQTLLAVKCMYTGILQTFVNLAIGLSQTPGSVGLFVTAVEDTIKDYENLANAWDEIRVKCYADTVINISMSALKYDVCDPSKDKDRPPPIPPPPPEKVPPGTPVPNSEPYDPETGDDDNSEPFPGDEPEDPTQGEVCQVYFITVSYSDDVPGFPSFTSQFSFKAWGKIGMPIAQGQQGGFTVFYLECQGIKEKPGGGAEVIGQCGTYRPYLLGNNGLGFPQVTVSNFKIVSIIPST